ncbi:MAG: DUF6702 family protein [Lutibacter sp.]|uniref:DUF6702 family protein n=1 Tax=Lutibacter sp. TaxID=1925666 RepID=UPI00299D4876|nr:DUF6702 family protein [Lutibacter sp.]MDX1830180.1 DUF6702 family protein [Lutibacter sp.]
MKQSKYVFLFFLIIPLFAFTLHKYYVSLTEIEYVEKQKSVQIITSIFIDDLEVDMRKQSNKVFNIDTKQEIDSIDYYFKNYLHQHFQITINDSINKYNYIGKEYEDNIVHFYLEVPNIERLNSIQIINTSLFESFENQQNIVKINVKDFNKTFYLTKNNDKGLLNF